MNRRKELAKFASRWAFLPSAEASRFRNTETETHRNKMKTLILTLAGVLCAGLLTVAAAEKVEGGPKGGRILEKTNPKAEFFVEKDKSVSIGFYDAAGKAVAPSSQNVTVIVDAASGKQKLEFEKKGDALVSKTKLPEGDGYNVVVQFKQTLDAKPRNFRFKYDSHTCGGCKRAEYACTCNE